MIWNIIRILLVVQLIVYLLSGPHTYMGIH